MSKSSKMVSLFLSTALIISAFGCAPQQQLVYDQDGNQIIIDEEEDDGFFGGFIAPFGFSKKHSPSVIRPKSSGITSDSSSVYPNSSGTVSSSTPNNKAGVSSGGSSSTGGTGITSGTHGGIGGGGSSAS